MSSFNYMTLVINIRISIEFRFFMGQIDACHQIVCNSNKSLSVAKTDKRLWRSNVLVQSKTFSFDSFDKFLIWVQSLAERNFLFRMKLLYRFLKFILTFKVILDALWIRCYSITISSHACKANWSISWNNYILFNEPIFVPLMHLFVCWNSEVSLF